MLLHVRVLPWFNHRCSLLYYVFWMVLQWLPSVWTTTTMPPLQGQPYCENGDFSPVCRPDEVVNMTFALYGRMELGRCATTNYGHIPCWVDVLERMHTLCSGRQGCTVRIPDASLDAMKRCPPDFKTYLQADYTCTPVAMRECDFCRTSAYNKRFARIRSNHGYISSSISQQDQPQNCGTSACPWRIEVQEGQKINLTVYDYTRFSGPTSCRFYGTAKQKSQPTDTRICAGQNSKYHLLTTQSHLVDIEMTNNNWGDVDNGHIVIEYEALGCPYFEPPANTRVSHKSLTATIFCDQTNEKWERTCIGNNWDGDLAITCPAGIAGVNEESSISLPLGVLIAIIVGIALVIGVLILTSGLVYLKRQQHQDLRRQEVCMYSRRRESSLASDDAAAAPLRGPKPGGKRVALPPLPNIRENVYMESRPLPSLPEEYAAREAAMAASASPRVHVHRTMSTGSGISGVGDPRSLSSPTPPPQGFVPQMPSSGAQSGPQSTVVSVHAKPQSSGAAAALQDPYSGRYSQPIDSIGPPPQLRAQKKPPPPRRLTPQGQATGGPPPPRVLPPPQQQQQMPLPPPAITEDPAYFVLDPEAAATSGPPQPPQTLFGAQMIPAADTSNGIPSDKQKSPEQENAENFQKEEAGHTSCQDLPCDPHLQKLDPTKGNSSWP